jgi:hypothetical protein
MGERKMKKSGNAVLIIVFMMFAGIAGVSAKGAGNGELPEVENIIKRYISAIGGEKNLKSVQSRVTTYKVFLQTREGYLVTQTVDRKGTLTSRRQGSDRYLFFDGQKLWNISKEQKKELGGKVVDQFRRKASLDGPFIDYDTKGIQFRCLGKKRVEFSHFLEVEATWKDGTKIFFYFDESDGLLKMKKEPSWRMLNGKVTEGPGTITYFYDYRNVDGILFPFSWIQTDDKLDHMHLFRVEKIEMK